MPKPIKCSSDTALLGRGCKRIERACVGTHSELYLDPKRLECRTTEGASPVAFQVRPLLCLLEYRRTREIRWEAGPTTVQGSVLDVTDSAQYREGTVKSTPVWGVKERLKPIASMQ